MNIKQASNSVILLQLLQRFFAECQPERLLMPPAADMTVRLPDSLDGIRAGAANGGEV